MNLIKLLVSKNFRELPIELFSKGKKLLFFYSYAFIKGFAPNFLVETDKDLYFSAFLEFLALTLSENKIDIILGQLVRENSISDKDKTQLRTLFETRKFSDKESIKYLFEHSNCLKGIVSRLHHQTLKKIPSSDQNRLQTLENNWNGFLKDIQINI